MAAMHARWIVQVQHLADIDFNEQADRANRNPRKQADEKRIPEATMAYLNTTRAGSFGILDRIAVAVKSVKVMVQRRAVYLQTVRELNNLTDRELADLDISRSMIQRLAVDAAYGN